MSELVAIILEKAAGGFAGANLFALTTSYVRINSHLRMQPNSMKLWKNSR